MVNLNGLTGQDIDDFREIIIKANLGQLQALKLQIETELKDRFKRGVLK